MWFISRTINWAKTNGCPGEQPTTIIMANGQNHNCLLSSYLYTPKLEPGLAFIREASYCQKMLITAEITTSQCVENKRLEPA